jgi:hypothetical protein
LIEYAYGQGKVIVGTLYSDWGYGHGQCSSQEQSLIRDIVRYADNGSTAIDEYVKGAPVSQTITVPLPYGEQGEQIAYNATVAVYRPDGSILSSQSYVLPNNGDTANVTCSLPTNANSADGIYTVKYSLSDETGNIVHTETCAKRFTIKEPVAPGGYVPGV